MQWRSLLATIIIAIALAGYFLTSSKNNKSPNELQAPAQPGYYLKQATLVETGADGNARIKLQATQVHQNVEDETINLQEVSVKFKSEDGTPWVLTANQGTVPDKSNTVQFKGNVLIRTEDNELQRPKIYAAALNIDTERSIASTPEAVDFVMDQQHISGVGLEYDIKHQKLRLRSQVYGKFLRPTSNE